MPYYVDNKVDYLSNKTIARFIIINYCMSCYYYNCYYNCCNAYGSCPEWYSSSSYYYGQCWYYYNTTNVGGIAGGVVAGVIALIVIIAIICYCQRKRQSEALAEQARINAMNKHDDGGTTIIMNNPNSTPQYGQPAYGQPAYGYGQQPAYGQPGYYQQQQQQPIIITQ
jgi:hypothetical protein